MVNGNLHFLFATEPPRHREKDKKKTLLVFLCGSVALWLIPACCDTTIVVFLDKTRAVDQKYSIA
jgi:hypothetical protein